MEIFISPEKKLEIIFKSENSGKYYRFWNTSEDQLRKNSIKQLKFIGTHFAWELLKKWKLKKYELMKAHCKNISINDHILFKREPQRLEQSIKKLETLEGSEIKKGLLLEMLEEKTSKEYFMIIDSHLQNITLIEFYYLASYLESIIRDYIEEKILYLNLDFGIGLHLLGLEELSEYFMGYIYRFIYNFSLERKITSQNFKLLSGMMKLPSMKEERIQKEFRKYMRKKIVMQGKEYLSIETIIEEELNLILALINKLEDEN